MPASATTQPKPPVKRGRANSNAEMLSPTVLYSAEAEKAVLGCMMAQPAEVINDATVALLKEVQSQLFPVISVTGGVTRGGCRAPAVR